MEMQEIIEQFNFPGTFQEMKKHGNGHINDTLLLSFKQEDCEIKKYILQRLNTTVFKNPEAVMNNILHVTEFIKKSVMKEGGNPERETLNFVTAKDGKCFVNAGENAFYRAYLFVDDATSFERVEKPEDFYQSAFAFGRFQKLLSEFDAGILTEVIPNFHNTAARFERFKEVVKADAKGRAKEVEKEISFVMEHAGDMDVCGKMLREGQLPLRVTHNDTKLNNVLIDNATGKALCVLDLDTVMPGLSIHDFGDSIRFGANTASEDEIDLSKVSLDLKLFETYAKGFLDGCGGSLTENERKMLPMGAKIMTLECGMRFLTDYLEGDVYFKIDHETHNLERCRTQFTLVKDMENKWNEMQTIIEKLA